MKTSPVAAVVLLMGAGLIWVARRECAIQLVSVAPHLVETPVRQEARAAGPQASPRSRPVRVIRTCPVQNRTEVTKVLCGVLVTAYCCCNICCGSWSRFARTATSKDARICDGVAADPKLLPYGTRLWIPEVGEKVVDDTGGQMRQDARRGITHIDVRMASHSEARRFGVKWLNIVVLK